jgi:hypothetical protein
MGRAPHRAREHSRVTIAGKPTRFAQKGPIGPFRFYRRVRIDPGLRINLSKSDGYYTTKRGSPVLWIIGTVALVDRCGALHEIG